MLQNAASNYVGRVAGLVIWFFFTPFVLRHLGQAEYGLWIVVGSLVGYGYILNLGINAALIKFVAQYQSREDVEAARGVVATGLVLYALLGLACFGLSAALAPFLPALLHLPAEFQSTASVVMLLMGAEVGLAIPCGTGTAVLQGLHRYDLVNVVTTSATILTVVAMGLVLLLGGGLVGMVAVTLPITLASQLVSTVMIHRVAPQLRFGWRGARLDLVRPIVVFSGPLFVMQIAELLQRKTDEIVIGAFLFISAVTPYSLARRLADLTRRMTDQFVRVLLPLASELHAGDEPVRLQELYTGGTRLTLVLLLPMTCSLLVLGGAILTLWVGPSYAENEPLLRILTIAALASTSQAPASSILKGMARHRPLAVSSLCAGIANLGLSLLLVGPFGLLGVAIGTLIPTLAESLGFVLPYTLWVLRVSVSDVIRDIVMPTFIPAGVMTATLYALTTIIEPFSLPSLLLVIAVATVVYLLAYLLIGASTSERQLCSSVAFGTLRLAGFGRQR
jgi:O-antigen/teichoic acid export membrane protein